MLARDRYHMMNARSGYVAMRNDDAQQNTVVPIDLLHLGEHFSDIAPDALRAQRRRHADNVLPRTYLLQMIMDGHWQRPTGLGTR